jgi:hypothetical protein
VAEERGCVWLVGVIALSAAGLYALLCILVAVAYHVIMNNAQ